MCSSRCARPCSPSFSWRVPAPIHTPSAAVTSCGMASVTTRSPFGSVVTFTASARRALALFPALRGRLRRDALMQHLSWPAASMAAHEALDRDLVIRQHRRNAPCARKGPRGALEAAAARRSQPAPRRETWRDGRCPAPQPARRGRGRARRARWPRRSRCAGRADSRHHAMWRAISAATRVLRHRAGAELAPRIAASGAVRRWRRTCHCASDAIMPPIGRAVPAIAPRTAAARSSRTPGCPSTARWSAPRR